MKILTFGEVLWDVFPDAVHIGGAVMNFSVHAARLGADVCFASAVGNDEPGHSALKFMESHGLDTKHVHVSDTYETGKCLVTFGADTTPSYDLLQNVAYDHIPEPVGEFDVLCYGTLSQRSADNVTTLKNLLKNSYREIFADINIRPPFYSDETIALCLENATILKVSDEELHYISDTPDVHQAAREIMAQHKNLRLIIVTLGEKGAFVYDGKRYISKEAVKTEVASTVGAGDSFSAAFLTQYLKGASLDACLDSAVRLSAFVVSQQAAVPDYDSKDFL